MQEPENTNLTPDKARSLLEMFSRQIREYGRGFLQPARRLITAQRPFYERYQYKRHNGAQEMARRVRQMNRGHCPSLLTAAADGTRYTWDSHGALCRFYS